ncbi:MAG: amidase [Betaproteobacteria bacterium]|nr:amidase [Betaproteobacteria bacterium]
MKTDLCSLSASELLQLYRTRKASPVEATRAVLDRIGKLNPVLNCFCLVDEKAALARAKESEARWRKSEPKGLLDGVPASIKDLLLTKGWPTRRGSKTVNPAGPWNDDAPCVARLREHGAVLVGKTTTPEFGWKGVTDNPLTGITRNPWNPKMTPGGSSGGSTAAVAAGMGPLTVGTDGGGSIRIPCAFTGLFGLKPTFGRVPAWPLSPFGTVAHVGPITRTVTDAALMMNVLGLPDARDWHALPYDPRDYRVGLEDGVKGLRVAYSAALGYADVDREVAVLVRRAALQFSELGAHVEEADPGFENAGPIFTAHWFPGAAALLRSLDGEQLKLVDPGLRDVARQGARIRTDLLVTPTLPLAAFGAGREVANLLKEKRWTDWSPFSYPFNLTQQPAASIPCGLTRKGLPVGLHIVGPRYADALVLRAARAYESIRPIVFPEISKLKN